MSKKTDGKTILISLLAIVVIFILCTFIIQNSQNKAYVLEEQVNTAKSDITVQEKRRVRLITELVDCVKEYDEYEAATLLSIIESRGSTGDISDVTTAITAVTEAYPELKSNENYKHLMNELSITENLVAEYSSNYNKQIKEYNRYVRKFPTRNFLSMLGYEMQDYTYLEYDVPEDALTDLFGDK